MLRFLLVVSLIQCGIGQNYQKVAPGVPPQNYQQPPPQQGNYQPPPPPQQQYQQPPQQFQQQPPQQQQFQQQPPQQQQFQQQPPQQQFQQPPPQQFEQDHPHHPDHVLNTANIGQEREHIQEHMDVPIDTSKMTDQELQFHYFKMHDTDNNNKLDGCELIKSLIHWHEQGHKQQQPQEGAPPPGEKIFGDDELVSLIDPIMNMDDQNRDGYIDYPEFIRAQQKSQAQANQNNNNRA